MDNSYTKTGYIYTAVTCGCVCDNEWFTHAYHSVGVSVHDCIPSQTLHFDWTELPHWGRDKMAAVSQTMFSNAFSWMKMYEFRLHFHWSLVLRLQLMIFQHLFRYWPGAVQATSHYLNQWWLIYWRIYASLGLNELTKPTHGNIIHFRKGRSFKDKHVTSITKVF